MKRNKQNEALGPDLFEKVFNSLVPQIALIDARGNILHVNRSWSDFAADNDGLYESTRPGVNYLDVCRQAAEVGDDDAETALAGILEVIRGEKVFCMEYPCDSPKQKRWFMMRVTRIEGTSEPVFVISHADITQRKLAEEELLKRSNQDGLTGLFNRDYLEEFLDNEWRRCLRRHVPITAVMLDLDDFKLLNDTYGHIAGDQALVKVGEILKRYTRRPGDIAARYGGEEFLLLFGGIEAEHIQDQMAHMLDEIRDLRLPNSQAQAAAYLTASIGIATLRPGRENSSSDLIAAADDCLYQAKSDGRNRIANCA